MATRNRLLLDNGLVNKHYRGNGYSGYNRRKILRWIKMDIRDIGWGGMDWFDLAQGGDRWPVLVNMVMNPGVP
jgi:hypothetical protein